jgi:iron complex outermembrane receptor protein
MRLLSVLRPGAAVGLLLAAGTATVPAAETVPNTVEVIQVTATRLPVAVNLIPASISVVTGDELASRGASDLRSALSLMAGVDIAPGGDGGPAASVPGLWGLREFDAFLLVVDGVPWGGAFNPALAALVLSNIERVEVLRGAAPVMYGATSFVGVIHVIHRAAGEPGRLARLSYGSFGSATLTASSALPPGDRYRHSLVVDGEHRGYSDPRAGVDRAHLLYRGALDTGPGELRLDADLTGLRQEPASPHLREGKVLAPGMPLDANYNPSDAHLDQDRYQAGAAYDHPLDGADWTTTLALTHTRDNIVRGFVHEAYVDDGSSPNAAGYAQNRQTIDLYFDSHLVQSPAPELELTYGMDYLYGKADQRSDNFDYYVPADGAFAPDSAGLPIRESSELADRRDFLGAYLQLALDLSPGTSLLAGIRMNHTREERESEQVSQSLSHTRLGGVIGLNWKAWEDDDDVITLFADYRNTFKPAAIDFGPESDAGILKPETADSYEAGLKSQWMERRLGIDLSYFDMRLDNLVVTQSVGGRPGLTNAGRQRFKGAELGAHWQLTQDWQLAANYAWHDARFEDCVQLFDGIPTQLNGNYLEMSPRDLGGLGLVYQPVHGMYGSVVWNHVGSRYLNKRNTVSSGAYNTLDASLGWPARHWAVALTGHNLTNERPPIAESELGESQYYRLPARSYEISVSRLF